MLARRKLPLACLRAALPRGRRDLITNVRPPLVGVSRRQTYRHGSSVMLSEERLKEFMQAEIGYFAGMSAEPVELLSIFKASTPELAGDLLLRQLPIHFATRIKHIEDLAGWESNEELMSVRDTLTESFQRIRLLDPSLDDLEPLTAAIKDIRHRHKSILPLLGVAMASLRDRMLISEAAANSWLDEFLLARISTEMCTLHYVMLVSGRDVRPTRMGIIDRSCDPSEICRKAVANVHKDPTYSSVPMPVESFVCSSSEKGIAFSFLPQYLLMIVEELIKNAAYATVLHTDATHPRSSSKSPVKYPPVCVFVGADDRQVMIEVSDKGGGIPTKSMDSIWSYKPRVANSPAAAPSEKERLGMSWADPMAGDPLSGLGIKKRLGMGLPLTRLYTQYLGGSLELMSLPGIGVDTFIKLKRIDPDEVSLK